MRNEASQPENATTSQQLLVMSVVLTQIVISKCLRIIFLFLSTTKL